MKIIVEGPISKLNQVAWDTYNKYKDIKNYNWDNDNKYTSEDIPKIIPKEDYKNIRVLDKNDRKGTITLSLDTKKLSPELKRLLTPDTGELYKYILNNDYNAKHKTVIEVPVDMDSKNNEPKQAKTKRIKKTRNEAWDDEYIGDATPDDLEDAPVEYNDDLLALEESIREDAPGFNEWLLAEYGVTSDDMTDDDYDMYWEMYEDEFKEESVMVPTPTPYKSKNRRKDKEDELNEGLQLNITEDTESDTNTGDKYTYSVTYYDTDEEDYTNHLVLATDPENALDKYKEEYPGETAYSISNNSYTDPEVYYTKDQGFIELDESMDDLWDDNSQVYDSRYVKIASKRILDSDGLWTDYTWYYDKDNDTHIFMYGDWDMYGPDFDYADYECETEDEARDWFDSYGEDNDNEYESFNYDEDWDYDYYDVDSFKELATKVVEIDDDQDEYTLYECTMDDGNTLYVCIYGDVELYDPSNTEWDFSSDTLEAAQSWFDTYGEEEYESLELKNPEDDILIETPGLTLTEPYTTDGITLEIDINGKHYKYVMNPESDKTLASMVNTVTKMQKYSDGKALAYLKKNMKLAEAWGDEYYGKTEAEKYGDMIQKKCAGMNISKRVADKDEPYGLPKVAESLGIDMWDLLDALEGMCYDGRAFEIDDSTYRVKAKTSEKSPQELLSKIFNKYPDLSEEDEDYLNGLSYDELVSEVRNRGWDLDELLTEDLTDTDTEVIKIINDVYKDKGELESDDAVNAIKLGLKDKNISVDDDYLSDMIVKSLEMIDTLDEQLTEEVVKEDYILHPGKKYKTKSGHMLKITDVVTSLSEFDGHPIIEIEYHYETTDGASGSSYCSAQDFYSMLNESIDVKEWTQVSNIGQHKRSSIDMIEGVEDTEDKTYIVGIDMFKGSDVEREVQAPSVEYIIDNFYGMFDFPLTDDDMLEYIIDPETGIEYDGYTGEVIEESTGDGKAYSVAYDVGDNFSKVTKVQADSLINAMKKFRKENPDKEITSIFEESMLRENTYVVTYKVDDEDTTRKFMIPHADDEEAAKRLFDVSVPQIGNNVNIISIDKIKSKKMEGNSFKDHHICQGCGNPLSKCTCKVDGFDD